MTSGLGKFGFAGVVTAVLLLAVVAVAGKAALDGAKGAGGGGPTPQAAAGGPKAPGGGGPGGGAPGGGGGGGPAQVRVETIAVKPLYDVVQAIGTAQARESVTITSKVTDVIQSIRFDSGDTVARGQVLMVLSSVEQQADLAEARAQLDAAKRDYDRFVELGQRGFAPVSRVEETRAAFERAQARVAALQSRIADRTIRAPFAGVIGLRTASPGTLARPGDPIATLDDLSAIKLDFDVPESQIALVQPGAEIEARSAAVEGVFRGRVEDVDSRLNPTTRTLRARAVLPNPARTLKPGMLLTVNVRYNPRNALSAPELALLERSDGLFVYRVDQREGRSVAAISPVKVGRRVGGRAEILDGLKDGDVVVVEGVQRVRPGQPVQIVAPANTAEGAAPKAAPPKAAPKTPAPNAPAKTAPTAGAPPAPTAAPPAAPAKAASSPSSGAGE